MSQCGDCCSANLKAAHVFDIGIGLNAPFTECSSHTASGTIRSLCDSKTF